MKSSRYISRRSKSIRNWILECGARRQKWIDMGQSLNLYIAEPSGKKLNDMYMLAWKKGLKTTYYLRSLGATQIEKSTLDINKRGLQPRWMKNKSASSNVKIDREEAAPVVAAPAAGDATKGSAPMPKAMCSLDGDCESCHRSGPTPFSFLPTWRKVFSP